MLDNLEPAKKVEALKDFRPGLMFDGVEGTATTEGLPEPPNFDEFLKARGVVVGDTPIRSHRLGACRCEGS
jgi:hypothetical protein